MTIKLGGIIPSSIVNGDGIRTVLFSTGCIHNCEGCHNKHLMDYSSGEDFTIEDLVSKINSIQKGNNKKVTFSGGDPFFQAKSFSLLAKELKKQNYNIWCYTGYKIEDIINSNNDDFLNLLNNIDVLVDGTFDKNLQEGALKYTGSSNQRILNIKEYLQI